MRVPLIGPKGADEVRRQVVDRRQRALAALVDRRVGAVGIGEEAERRFKAAVRGGSVDAHAVLPGRPEGAAVRVDQPPAPAVVLGTEKAGGLELFAGPAAPAPEALRPTLRRSRGQLPLQALRDLLDAAALR